MAIPPEVLHNYQEAEKALRSAEVNYQVAKKALGDALTADAPKTWVTLPRVQRNEAMANLAIQLYTRREAKGWTLQDIGRRLGIKGITVVSRIECGGRGGGVRRSTLEKLATIFNCTVEELLAPIK